MARVLFVCGGSTCRSPMAAALAEHAVPTLEADTAGIAPGEAITTNAIAVIAERTGTDRRDHCPRALEAVSPSEYDAVVAMDVYVARAVIEWTRPDLPVFIWSVPDPYLQPKARYDVSADTIEDLVAATFFRDGAPKEMWTGFRPDTDPVTQLLAKLVTWKAIVDNVSLSYSRGIATTAAGDLERLLKILLSVRLSRLGVPLSDLLRAVNYKGAVNEIEALPLGTVVSALGRLSERDPDLEAAWKPTAATFAAKFVEMRNVGVHDTKDVKAATKAVLEAVEATIGQRGFRDLLRAAVATAGET